jgi:glycerol-3-phosphate acyltransferase PlsX
LSDITIALDAMGGDHGPSVVIPAAIETLRRRPELNLILVGQRAAIEAQLQSSRHYPQVQNQIIIHHTDEVVTMDELPSAALRMKKKSSMRLALEMVKDGVAQACVSAGNTGALTVIARFVLKTLPGIDRPAIMAELPTINGHKTRMLDLGANVDSSAEILFQSAVMGSIISRNIDKIEHPSIALLNIGTEDIKGNEQVKRAAELLSQAQNLNYLGYIEGNQLYQGNVNVVVCDGFVGNVALKSSEGVAKLLADQFNQAFRSGIYPRLVGLLALPIFRSLRKQINPERYNGASLMGLNGIVVKSHGGASSLGFRYAIEEAVLQVKSNVTEKISTQIAEFLAEGYI